MKVLEVSRERVLENVFCCLTAPGATLEEAEEGAVVLDQQLDAGLIEPAMTAKSGGSFRARVEARCRSALGTSRVPPSRTDRGSTGKRSLLPRRSLQKEARTLPRFPES